MATALRKTELSPLESLVVERALGEEAHTRAANNPLPRIQALTQERQKLYAKSAAHPFLAPLNRARILAIGVEIELLWEALRRQRATRRTQMERALNVTAEDEDEQNDREERDELNPSATPLNAATHEARHDDLELDAAPAPSAKAPKRRARKATDAA